MTISVGQVAPLFSLFDTTKTKINLSDFRERNVLLLFFPLAFTSTCTKELCSVRDNITLYNDANAEVLGISADSPYSLRKYKEEQSLNFTLLSDFNRSASLAYDSLYPVFSMEMQNVPKRAAFVIDREGIIRYAEVLENANEVPDFEAIEKILLVLTEGK
ncbi:MAG: redoxin domain-containing protein [Chitinophagaceae bacterium]|nr:redoxin domain-containing protein [Chitinophagaceae bacterium]